MTQTDPLCPRTELPASMCSHCRGLPWDPPGGVLEPDDLDPAPPVTVDIRPMRGILAEHRGTCPLCGVDIRPGDVIVLSERRWVCAECADDQQG